MASVLHDILTAIDCLSCGKTIVLPCDQLMVHRVAACACGTVIRIEERSANSALAALGEDTLPVISVID